MTGTRKILTGALLCLTTIVLAACTPKSEDDNQTPISTELALTHNHFSGVARIDPDSGEINVDWVITLIEPQLETITYLLNQNFADVSVGGDVAGYELQEDEVFGSKIWKIIVQVTPFSDAHREITISYGGVLLPEPMENRINTISPDKIELTVDSLWHPFDNRFTESVTTDLKVYIPGEWTGITSGTVERESDGALMFKTMPGLDIPVTLLSSFRKSDAPGYTIYDTRDTSDGLAELVESSGACTTYLNDRYGDVDPLPEAKIVVHDREASGYARQTLIALSEISGRDQSRLMQFICHELAHYWSRRGAANTVENWLNETFADYVALMALRDVLGEEVFEEFLTRYRAQVEEAGDLPPIWTPEDQERGPYLVQYRKGPLALAQLEERLGRDAFAQFIHRYMTDGIATTPALLDALEEIAGPEARDQFAFDLAQ